MSRTYFSYYNGPTQSRNATLIRILVPTERQRNTETLFATTTHRVVLYLIAMMKGKATCAIKPICRIN